ncbi:MAG: cytochrome bc complex cytochrome b subunit [Anaerolineae bacterium]|jgi:quinol-cytochrome oxidoreductase complex cytochrome b subunit|nr:cytochrome bc complex cytochrome b subunit [Anaerolineae bacterium]
MTILPFPSILDDIKEKGLKKALYEGVDDVVQRVTAGMNIQDIREALRGEAPSRRPNPRLQPHADGFWLHMRPSFFHRDMTGIYPTFRLGWLSTYFVVFETITGMFLMIWYTPSPQVAYANMLNILGNVPLGQLMRDLHRLGAEAMVLIVWLHMLRTFMTGSYKKPRQFTWFTGVILLIATMFLSFSGYLLPWDQLALWAVTIGASMVEATPPAIVGENLNLLFRGGPEIAENGLLRFYLLHVLLVPALLFIFTGVHYYKVIVHGHSLPPRSENIGEDTAKRVPLEKRVYFIPDIMTSEIMWVAVTTFIMILLCVWFYHAPLENHADPQVTPLGTTAPWYFLWIQGALKLGDKVLWGIVFPTVVIVLLMVWPYVDTTPSRRYADRKWAMTFCFLFISIMTALSYMGLPEYGVAHVADQDVLHLMTMEPAHGHMGKLLPIPYDQLVPGAYTTLQIRAGEENAEAAVGAFNVLLQSDLRIGEGMSTQFRSAYLTLSGIPRFTEVPEGAYELHHALEEYEHAIQHFGAELYNGWGVMIITQDQPDLKRVDLVLMWEDVERTETGAVRYVDGRPVPIVDENGLPVLRWATDHVFIHRDAAYFAAH